MMGESSSLGKKGEGGRDQEGLHKVLWGEEWKKKPFFESCAMYHK